MEIQKSHSESVLLSLYKKTDYSPVLQDDQRINLPLMVDVAQQEPGLVQGLILAQLVLTSELLGLSDKIDPKVLNEMAKAIIDEYKFNSIDSILIALRNGGRGKYGKTYNSLNMPLICGWIGIVLESDSKAREKKNKSEKKEIIEVVDYEEYGKRVEKEREEAKKKRESSMNILTPEERGKLAKELLKKIQ